MKKGILIIGKRKFGRADELEKVLTAELGTNRESIRVDKIDSQHVILDGLDERLDSTTLTELMTGIWELMPHARIVATLDSIESLAQDDLKYAQEHFDILFGIGTGRFVEFNEDEEILDGLPVRMYLLEESPWTPQFFQDINESTLRKAMTILRNIYGDEVTIEHLNDLLHNRNNQSEKMIKKSLEHFEEDAYERYMLDEARSWFADDYLSGAKGARTATKTYDRTSSLRAIVHRLYQRKHG